MQLCWIYDGEKQQLTWFLYITCHSDRSTTTLSTHQNHNSLLFAIRTSWLGRMTSQLSATCTNLLSCTTSKCDLWSPESSIPTVVLIQEAFDCQTLGCSLHCVGFQHSVLLAQPVLFPHFRYYTGGCKSIQTAPYLWRCNHSCLLRPEHGRHGPPYICSGRGGLQTDGQVTKTLDSYIK